jgi:hypothetical protein
MYNKQVSLAEEVNSGGGNYIPVGVHKVFVKSLAIEPLQTPNYTGNIAKLVIANDEGKELEETIYPFKFNESFKVWKDGKQTDEIVPQAQQEDDYLLKHKELFSRAAKGGEAAYDTAVNAAGITSFETYIAAISGLVTRAVGGNYIWQLVKANKKNFATIAMHKGGSTRNFVEGQECPLKFDEAKYGKKELNESKVEAAPVAATTGEDELPF